MAMPIRKTKKTKDGKPKQSVSDTKRELAMQARATGKKVGPKARAQRLAAKRLGKTIKKQDKSAAKRGGMKPAGSPAKKTTTTPTRRAPGMTTSQARQEVALTKRAQERKKEATGTPKKKITAKQTAYRETRRWGTSREAFKLSKANRNRLRG